MRARDVMDRNVAFCTPDTSLLAVALLMRDEERGCLPIRAGDHPHRLVGMVTDHDLVCRALANDLDPAVTPVSLVMSSPVQTIHENASEEACAQRMADKRVRRLVVVDHRGRCCGIVSLGDIARRQPREQLENMAPEFYASENTMPLKELAGTELQRARAHSESQ